MRLVNKDLHDKPAILIDQNTLDNLHLISHSKNGDLIIDDIYKGAYKDAHGKTQSSVREKLNEYYFGKCAYCEGQCIADIEHYRPKKWVIGVPMHKGYFWLAYEWSNLVPSCRFCNTGTGKSGKFPIHGTRVFAPPINADNTVNQAALLPTTSPLKDELPYLLHPEIDDPFAYLAIELDATGEGLCLVGTDGVNMRGERTVDICDLNRRNLKIDRLTVLDTFIYNINLCFQLVAKGVIDENNLPVSLATVFEHADSQKTDITQTFTFQRFFIMKNEVNFRAIVLPRLDNSQREIVSVSFEKYLESRLHAAAL